MGWFNLSVQNDHAGEIEISRLRVMPFASEWIHSAQDDKVYRRMVVGDKSPQARTRVRMPRDSRRDAGDKRRTRTTVVIRVRSVAV